MRYTDKLICVYYKPGFTDQSHRRYKTLASGEAKGVVTLLPPPTPPPPTEKKIYIFEISMKVAFPCLWISKLSGSISRSDN